MEKCGNSKRRLKPIYSPFKSSLTPLYERGGFKWAE
nr:MAG TPA: hypothetical protein [Caudoviricetes sp.]